MPDDLAGAVAHALDGHGWVRESSGEDAVDGVVPRCVVRPTTVPAVAAVMRAASRSGAAVVVRGAGTALDWGCPPERVDVLLDTTGLDRLVEHQPGDLVAVAQAGLPVRRLGELLARAGQELALDVPRQRLEAGSTVGGMLVAGVAGPRRMKYGGVRDHLLGVTVVLADGRIASSGGKVVKNVAGYDLAKLAVGSLGTLSVVVQSAWRLHSLPVDRAFVTVEADLAHAAHLAHLVITSQLAASAVELDRRGLSSRATVSVLVEGVPPAVRARAAAVARLVGGDVGGPPPGWGDLPATPGGVLLKATASLPGIGRVLRAAQEAEQRHGAAITLRGSASGVLYLGLAGDTDPAVVACVVTALRTSSPSAADGTVTVVRAPAGVRAVVDTWGEVPGLALMRRVKHRLDPGRQLSPGRFVGGI